MPKFEVPAVDGLSQAELNKATIRFNSTASGITGVVEDLRNEIRKIEDEDTQKTVDVFVGMWVAFISEKVTPALRTT